MKPVANKKRNSIGKKSHQTNEKGKFLTVKDSQTLG